MRRVVEVEPGNADQWNTLAYVQAYQGRTEEALKSVSEYERLAPASPNPLDSRGEILFMAGRFSEAESAFLACSRKDPDFNSGVALEKAALARMLGGDVSGAGAILERYLQQRREKKTSSLDSTAPVGTGCWATGRRAGAHAGDRVIAQCLARLAHNLVQFHPIERQVDLFGGHRGRRMRIDALQTQRQRVAGRP